jgi:hypothetical protein
MQVAGRAQLIGGRMLTSSAASQSDSSRMTDPSN